MPGSFQIFINKLLKVESRELSTASMSFLFVFLLMAAYYVLRPVRDAMSSDWTDAELSWLWTLTFFISTGAVLMYGFVVSRVKLKRLVPGVYIFFAGSFLLFYFGASWFEDSRIIDKAFYVWVSFFALFHVSVFWSFMSDIYSRSQSRRLFGLFGAGASIGAVVGPSIPVFLGGILGVYNLLLIAALTLLLIVPIIFFLDKARTVTESKPVTGTVTVKSIGGEFFDGFVDLLSHRFLLGIGLFILLYTIMSSFVYFELKNVMVEYDRATRSQYWGMMDLAVNTLAILTALFATSRLATRFGLAVTLALVPVVLVFGWIAVAIAPGLALLIGLQIVRRAGNYAITRPGREMLFTSVPRETRFKTKPVIDIVVYRGGDVLAGWTYTGLAQGIGLGLGAIAMVAALFAMIWTLVAIFLGTRFDKNSISAESPGTVLAETLNE
ncbi:MAG: MFS transporter [Gammaproteobacteria bacterium]|nr:MFS transporter [Gammaproteobacteria bacterium]